MSIGTQHLQLLHLAPRHIEMMHRLIRGQKQKKICEDLGISQARLSIIVHSPLFQLEMQKLIEKKEEQLYSIQEDFVDAAELGVKFHKEVLEAAPGTFTTDTRQKSATTMTVLASRLLRPGSQPSNGDGDESGMSYEERLRKVTIEESVRTVTPTLPQPQDADGCLEGLLEGDYPPPLELETGMEEDVLFGEMETEEDIFNPPVKIEETLAHAAGESH